MLERALTDTLQEKDDQEARAKAEVQAMRDRLTELKTEKVIARCECVTRRRREWPLRAFILHTHTHTLSLSHTHTHTHTLDQQEHLEVALADSRKSEGRDMASGSSSDRDAAVAGGIDLHSEIQKLQKELASQKALAFDLTGERDSLQKEMHELRSKHGLQQSGTGGGASSSTTPAKREMEALEAKLAHALQQLQSVTDKVCRSACIGLCYALTVVSCCVVLCRVVLCCVVRCWPSCVDNPCASPCHLASVQNKDLERGMRVLRAENERHTENIESLKFQIDEFEAERARCVCLCVHVCVFVRECMCCEWFSSFLCWWWWCLQARG